MILSFFLILGALQSTQIDLGGHFINVEIADTPTTMNQGLMGRKTLEEGDGMLFVYSESKRLSFWMKDTLIPLSIGFFDETQTLLEILDMPVPDPGTKKLPLFCSEQPARYALEVPMSWFKKNKIFPGMKFSFHDRTNEIE